MVSQATMNRYRALLQRVDLQTAQEIVSKPNTEWRAIKEDLALMGLYPKTKATVLAQKRLLANVLNELQREEPRNTELRETIELIWAEELRILREENQRLTQRVQQLEQELQEQREMMEQRLEQERQRMEQRLEQERQRMEQEYQERLNQMNNRLNELQKPRKEEQSEEERKILEGLEEEQSEEEQSEEEQSEEPKESEEINEIMENTAMNSENNDYDRTMIDGSKILHIIEKLELNPPLDSDDLMQIVFYVSDYLWIRIEPRIDKTADLGRFYIVLKGDEGLAITETLFPTFVPLHMINFSRDTLLDLLVRGIAKLKSKKVIKEIYANITLIKKVKQANE